MAERMPLTKNKIWKLLVRSPVEGSFLKKRKLGICLQTIRSGGINLGDKYCLVGYSRTKNTAKQDLAVLLLNVP